jgi:hypothetical protein
VPCKGDASNQVYKFLQRNVLPANPRSHFFPTPPISFDNNAARWACESALIPKSLNGLHSDQKSGSASQSVVGALVSSAGKVALPRSRHPEPAERLPELQLATHQGVVGGTPPCARPGSIFALTSELLLRISEEFPCASEECVRTSEVLIGIGYEFLGTSDESICASDMFIGTSYMFTGASYELTRAGEVFTCASYECICTSEVLRETGEE